jgi:hypothetical protein
MALKVLGSAAIILYMRETSYSVRNELLRTECTSESKLLLNSMAALTAGQERTCPYCMCKACLAQRLGTLSGAAFSCNDLR